MIASRKENMVSVNTRKKLKKMSGWKTIYPNAQVS